MHLSCFTARTSTAKLLFIVALRARLLLLTTTFLICSAAFAQYLASIQGTVTDTQGGVIPGAKLTLTNTATNESQARTSNDVGVYSFNALPPNTFKLIVEKDGFQTKVLNNLQIIPEQPNSIDIKLEVGAIATT